MVEEFKKVYFEYSDKIFRFLFWHLGDTNRAEDLTSEVFLRAFKNWKNFKGNFRQAWLYRIAKNLLIDFYRSKKTSSFEEVGEIAVDPELLENLDKKEEIQRVRKAVEKLPENLKAVVVLRFFEELSAAETGKILEISEVNVRVLQFRALKKLKEELK